MDLAFGSVGGGGGLLGCESGVRSGLVGGVGGGGWRLGATLLVFRFSLSLFFFFKKRGLTGRPPNLVKYQGWWVDPPDQLVTVSGGSTLVGRPVSHENYRVLIGVDPIKTRPKPPFFCRVHVVFAGRVEIAGPIGDIRFV
jgi:hypothetical protein